MEIYCLFSSLSLQLFNNQNFLFEKHIGLLNLIVNLLEFDLQLLRLTVQL